MALHDKENANNNINNDMMLLISNLSYKETEDTIKDTLSKYGKVKAVRLQRNKQGGFIGKAVVTFYKKTRIQEDIILNNKVLRVERIKDRIHNDTRIFVSRINRDMSILQIRNILKEVDAKPEDIRVRYDTQTKKNPGYCHLTYKRKEDAENFEHVWKEIQSQMGKNAYYEYSVEKYHKQNKSK